MLPLKFCVSRNISKFLFSFTGTAKPIRPVRVPIGRVNVEDQDDWDLPDKIFLWRDNKPHPNFELNEDTGELSMVEILSGGKYTLYFKVIDQKRGEEVEAVVTVTVKEIPEEAVYSSGSIRISGKHKIFAFLCFYRCRVF